MTPYLIAHKVRGEPAFDIAERLRCPICEPMRQGLDDGSGPFGCAECEDGFWWIVSTSGHRAYPYWRAELVIAEDRIMLGETENPITPGDMPPDLPDHFPTNAAPKGKGSALDQVIAALFKPSVTRR